MQLIEHHIASHTHLELCNNSVLLRHLDTLEVLEALDGGHGGGAGGEGGGGQGGEGPGVEAGEAEAGAGGGEDQGEEAEHVTGRGLGGHWQLLCVCWRLQPSSHLIGHRHTTAGWALWAGIISS